MAKHILVLLALISFSCNDNTVDNSLNQEYTPKAELGEFSKVGDSTLTAKVFQTAASGQRVIISGADNNIRFYDQAGNLSGSLEGGSSGTLYYSGNFTTIGHLSAFGNGAKINIGDVYLTHSITEIGVIESNAVLNLRDTNPIRAEQVKPTLKNLKTWTGIHAQEFMRMDCWLVIK